MDALVISVLCFGRTMALHVLSEDVTVGVGCMLKSSPPVVGVLVLVVLVVAAAVERCTTNGWHAWGAADYRRAPL